MSDASANININFEGDAFIAIKNLQGEFNKLIQKVTVFEGDVKESFNSLNTSVKTYKTAISQLSFAAIADNVRNVTDAFRGTVQPGLDFEQKMADLSAITGVSGNDLSVLSAAAREMGTSSGIGAAQAVEAFKLLASNIDIATIGGVEGLKALQKETITLAQAAGTDLPMAADTMSFALNQFQLPVSEAARVINTLGAGAKYGAAEIPDLAAALKDSGSVAKQAGLSIEDATGAIEILSQRGLKGSEAGNALRNVLLILQTQNIPGVNLKTQGLSGALAAMQKHLGNATYMAKLFGRENINAAQILISGASSVKEMTDKVTGTQVAYEQAAIRTKTYAHEIELVKARMDDFKISIFNATGSMLPWSEYLIQTLVPLSQMVPLFGAIGTGIKALTTAQWALNAAQYAMPILAIVAGLTMLGAAIYSISKNYDAATLAAEDFKDAQQRARESTIDEKFEAEQLIKTARNLRLSYEQRQQALDKLKTISKEYFGQLTIDTITTEKATIAFNEYAASIEKVALAEVLKEKIKERIKKGEDLKENGPEFSWWENLQNKARRLNYQLSAGRRGAKDADKLTADELDAQISQNRQAINIDESRLFNLQYGSPAPAPSRPLVESPQRMEYMDQAAGIMKNKSLSIARQEVNITINTTKLEQSTAKVKETLVGILNSAYSDYQPGYGN